ncbi:DUF4013 domain-containing protein [bacterium]|nr:DUF4013 domain-containing protein [bacterium]
MRINLAKAFNLGADDPDGWKSAALFALVVIACSFGIFLILPGLFLMLYGPGYLIQYTRNVATGDNNKKLPEIASGAGLWHGFITMLVFIVYCLPLMGVLMVGLGGAVAGLLSGAKMDSPLVSMGSLAGAGLMGIVACFMGLVIFSFVPMVTLQYCKNYQFGDAFNFGAIFSGMFRSPLDYLAIIAIPFILNLVAGMIPVVGWVASPFVALISANLVGQYGAHVLEMSGETPVSSDVGFSKF